MELEKYKHKKWSYSPNKKDMPINFFNPEKKEEFNNLFFFIRDHYTYVEPTRSGGITYHPRYKDMFRYTVIRSKSRFEIILVCDKGCFRFQFGIPKSDNNTVSGREALREIYKTSKLLNIDLTPYLTTPEEGLNIKGTILKPCIKEFCLKGKPYAEFENVHHLDFHSSYWSRIVEEKPELRPIAQYHYDKRHERDEYNKHVLTNSVGCMQSEYCIDYDDENTVKSSPYQLATLAKIGVDGTRHIVEEYLLKLIINNRKPLLANTDGIWYQGELYHDENEGTNLCQWSNDHVNCKLLVKSKGAYQYVENGKCTTVVRGETNYDAYVKRDDWQYGDILRSDLYIKRWDFTFEKGVVEYEQDL